MKKHILFGGDRYYPRGGIKDFKCTYNSIGACKYYYLRRCGRGEGYDAWAHIVEVKSMRIIQELDNDGEWVKVNK
jgi:hypothetical protein